MGYKNNFLNMARFCFAAALIMLPGMLCAQATEVEKMHNVLESLYNDMIRLTQNLIDVARGIAGFGAIWYIGVRVWRHIANAEPIDFFPLFRPFVLCILIGIFPQVLAVINGVMNPTITVTSNMVKYSNEDVKNLLDARKRAITQTQEWQALVGGDLGSGDKKEWYKYSQPDNSANNNTTGNGGISIGQGLTYSWNLVNYTLGYFIKLLLSKILQLAYFAAAICIDFMRTFHLIILSILGPFVFGMAVFDGFQQSLQIWLARYINYFLWLPIANILGTMINRIQAGMLRLDISQMLNGDGPTFTQTDDAYMIFLVIAVVGYFSIPSIANYIVHAHGSGSVQSKTSSLASTGASLLTKL